MVTPRQLATVRSYSDLHAALRARADELKVARQTLDDVSGLQDGYVAKLLAPVPVRVIGRTSLGPLLGALGCMLILVEDDEMLARIGRKLIRRKYACAKMLARQNQSRQQFLRNSEWGRLLKCRQTALLSWKKRRKIAKIAAHARWKRRKTP